MIAFSLRTLRKNTCLLNFISGSMYFFSLGFNVRTHALTTFHTTFSSKRICGEFPLARPLSFLSFNAYHRFSPFLILRRGMATLPRNSTLWSLSSSYTVTSNTELISFTLLWETNKKDYIFYILFRNSLYSHNGLQSEYFLPTWSQRFIFRLCLQSCVYQFQDAKRIALATQVSCRETLCSEYLYNERIINIHFMNSTNRK